MQSAARQCVGVSARLSQSFRRSSMRMAQARAGGLRHSHGVTDRSALADSGAAASPRHFLTLAGRTRAEIEAFLDLSDELKLALRAGPRGADGRPPLRRDYRPLQGRSVAMIFQKRSTRTRVSTETGVHLLGGHGLFLSSADIQLGASESVEDTARVLSRYNDAILARVYAHSDVERLAQAGSVPVINALSDACHPLQILADLQALRARFGRLQDLRVAWVGDGNNVLTSFMHACPTLGMHLRIATPRGFEPQEDQRREFQEHAAAAGTEALVGHDALAAVQGAHVVVTDTWISMGQEKEKNERIRAFSGFTVSRELCEAGRADPDWVFMHCLPRYPYEVTDDVFNDPRRSLVWDEAENRMWTVMAVLHDALVGPRMV